MRMLICNSQKLFERMRLTIGILPSFLVRLSPYLNYLKLSVFNYHAEPIGKASGRNSGKSIFSLALGFRRKGGKNQGRHGRIKWSPTGEARGPSISSAESAEAYPPTHNASEGYPFRIYIAVAQLLRRTASTAKSRGLLRRRIKNRKNPQPTSLLCPISFARLI